MSTLKLWHDVNKTRQSYTWRYHAMMISGCLRNVVFPNCRLKYLRGMVCPWTDLCLPPYLLMLRLYSNTASLTSSHFSSDILFSYQVAAKMINANKLDSKRVDSIIFFHNIQTYSCSLLAVW
jgi:hypothetical protein